MRRLDSYNDVALPPTLIVVVLVVIVVAALLRLATWDNPEPGMPTCPTTTAEVTVRCAAP